MTSIKGDACNPREPARLSQRGVLPERHDPHIVWTTGQRMPRVGENAYIHGIFECLSVVQPLGQRANGMVYPAYAKKLCVLSGRNAIHFRVRGCPGLTGPQTP
jgi:hypothetical protein